MLKAFFKFIFDKKIIVIFLFSIFFNNLFANEILLNSKNDSGDKLLLNEKMFEKIVIKEKLNDGYWVDTLDINADGNLDLVAYGLTTGKVVGYLNPGSNDYLSWREITIANLKQPVGMAKADVDGDGFTDIIITYLYGTTMSKTDKEGGRIVWLKNPNTVNKDVTKHEDAKEVETLWKEFYIGRDVAMHRIVVGNFSNHDKLQLMSLPVVGQENDIYSPISIALYDFPEDPENVDSWDKTLVSQGDFHVLHDAVNVKRTKLTTFDALLVSSQEGISWLYYSGKNNWRVKTIAKGDYSPEKYTNANNFFYGTNTAVIGRKGAGLGSYIAAIEPFHGNTLATYSEDALGKWQRKVAGDFGQIDEQGFGSGHHILSYDFDGDGSDEFLASYSKSPKGIIYGKYSSDEKHELVLSRITGESSARLSLGDFNNDGQMDVVSVGYNVPGYYRDPNPKIIIFMNK